MQTQADMGIGPVSCENCSVFKKGEGGPEAPGALRLRNKKATASVASSYSQNPPVPDWYSDIRCIEIRRTYMHVVAGAVAP